MNNSRKLVNLETVKGLTSEQQVVFKVMNGNRGRNFSADSLLKKLGDEFIPKDTKKSDLEKVTEKATKTVNSAFKALLKAGLVTATIKEEKVVEGEYVMNAYHVEDLPEEIQNTIGDKAHTSLTANGNTVFYKGDGIMYKPHALSPEGKAGQVVATGTVKSFHVNEEGFLYLIIEKPAETDKDGKTKKRKTCAVKASKAQLSSIEIPDNVTKAVTYKRKAGLVAPELQAMPDVSKGNHVILFTNIHSPKAKEFDQVIAGMNVKNLVRIDTDNQPAECKAFNIRIAPSLIIIKNGKVVETITDKITKVIK